MNQVGGRENRSVIPSLKRSIRINFRGAKISSDAGVLMLREIDERFNITAPLGDRLHDRRRASHLRHTYLDLIRWLIPRLIKVGASVSYHARKWHVHVSTAFPPARPYQEVVDSG
jgi:hypothetical protein